MILGNERGGRDLDDVFFLGGGVCLRSISVEVSVEVVDVWWSFWTGFLYFVGIIIFPPWMHAESSGKSTGDT